MDQISLAIRVVLSLAIVLGIMWAISRAMRGRAPAIAGLPLQVIARASLGKRSSIAVISVGGRGVLVGITDHQVTLLGDVDVPTGSQPRSEVRTKLDVPQFSDDPGAEDPLHELDSLSLARAQQPDGALAGSLLSPTTWRQSVSALRERTVRS